MTWAARRSGVTHLYPYVGICIVPNSFYHREASPLLLRPRFHGSIGSTSAIAIQQLCNLLTCDRSSPRLLAE